MVRVQRWKQVLLTIAVVTGVVIAASGLGLFLHQEWSMLDLFFRWRPVEPPDARIVLVTIDESDVQQRGQWPLSEPVLDNLLETLTAQHPRAIGLDLDRELPKIDALNGDLPDATESRGVPILSHNGLVEPLDFPIEVDGRVRQSWLSMQAPSGETTLNFGLRLGLKYLESEGITLEPLNQARSRYRLGQTVLVPLSGHPDQQPWGHDSGNRLLMNYRGTYQSFHHICLSDVLDGKIPPQLMRDRLILVGSISPRLSFSFYTPYRNNFDRTPERISELVIHANIASQILSAALDGRPLLKSISPPVRGVWILIWSALSVGVSLRWLQSRILQDNLALKLAVLSFGLLALGIVAIAVGYVAFLAGWWLPASAPISALIGSAIAVSISQVQQLQQKKTDLELMLETAAAQGDLASASFLEKYTQEVALESYTTAMQLMDVLPVGVAFIDTSGTVCYTNTRAQQLLGRQSTRPIHSAEIPEFYQIYLAGTDRLYPYEEFTALQALNGKSIRSDDMEIRNNNRITPLECWGTPIYDDRGNIQYAILVLQDISDRRQAYAERVLFHQELEHKTMALQEMEQLKDEFLKRTSHELRTPLNGIIGSIQLILDGFCENREEELEFLEQAKDSSQNLLMLINNLLDLNQIQGGDFSLNLETVDLHACLTKAIYLHLYTLQQKKLHLVKSYCPEPMIVRGDSLRITQVLVNLIGNAIKFTDEGSITITTEIQKRQDNASSEADLAAIAIRDTGIGIEPNLQDKMFEAFMMEDGSTTRSYSGIGLGLTISRKFMTMMGGKLTLNSPGKGQGTTVELSMPLTLPLSDRQTHLTETTTEIPTIAN